MKNKKKEMLLIGLGIVSILVVIIGVTYAFFNYTKQGSTNNVIETGTIKFLYDEKYGYGNGIQITDAMPMSDTLGKRQKGENQVFDFKITSDTMSNISIPYEITVRKDSSSTLPNSMIKIYLAKVYGENEEEITLDTFDKLSNPSTNLGLDNTIEKRIYKGKVPSNTSGYNQNFRLKMWIAEDADFSPTDESGESPYNGATFKVRVNVYSKGVPLTEEEVENEGKAEITGIEADDKKAVKVENRDYDYELGLASGTREINLDVLTESDDADTKIERVDNNTSMNSEIKRLSANKTLSLTEGNNLFRITTKSVDESITNTSIINIHVGGYQEAELNGTDPVLRNNLIPIMIKNDGRVYKVDTNYSWYNYENKEWANAIILKDKSISYDIGEEIPEENIESYFVWIPKYSYQIWDLGNYSSLTSVNNAKVHQIPIRFGTENTVSNNGTSCVTPISNDQGIAGSSSDCDNGEYMTHSAFITLGVNGFWVGKYETGYNQNSDTNSLISDTSTWTTAGAQVNSNSSNKVIIKPDVYSWRGIDVVHAFETGYNYLVQGTTHYSHMMKNTEWGAVAYLSHSKYGIGTEVRINNNQNYKTGYSALPSTNQLAYPGTYCNNGTCYQGYNTTIGYLSSTTGNITGIYDMSGGAHEFMSSYSALKNSNNPFDASSLSSYVSNYPYLFDTYPSNSGTNTYQNRILGDATGEMGPFSLVLGSELGSWYSDWSQFIDSDGTWFIRGGNFGYGAIAGQFGFGKDPGAVWGSIGFRIVVE